VEHRQTVTLLRYATIGAIAALGAFIFELLARLPA